MNILTFPEFYEKYKDVFKIGKESLRKIVKRKDFPKIMVGSQPKIIEDDVMEYFKNNPLKVR